MIIKHHYRYTNWIEAGRKVGTINPFTQTHKPWVGGRAMHQNGFQDFPRWKNTFRSSSDNLLGHRYWNFSLASPPPFLRGTTVRLSSESKVGGGQGWGNNECRAKWKEQGTFLGAHHNSCSVYLFPLPFSREKFERAHRNLYSSVLQRCSSHRLPRNLSRKVWDDRSKREKIIDSEFATRWNEKSNEKYSNWNLGSLIRPMPCLGKFLEERRCNDYKEVLIFSFKKSTTNFSQNRLDAAQTSSHISRWHLMQQISGIAILHTWLYTKCFWIFHFWNFRLKW